MKIDIIIPAYKAQDTIFQTLSSIAAQTIASDIRVTIVNDCDGIGYEKFINLFSPYIDIQEITLNENVGPGNARQAGINVTSNPLIVFADADDLIHRSDAIERMRKEFYADYTVKLVRGSILSEDADGEYSIIQNPFSWLFSKMYRRDALDYYQVKFNPRASYANEDVGFNKFFEMCLYDNEIVTITDVLYLWKYKPDSITRANDEEYGFNKGITGYVDNMIYAIENSFNHTSKDSIKFNSFYPMLVLYKKYIELPGEKEEFRKIIVEESNRFYNRIYKEIEPMLTEIDKINIYNNTFLNERLYKIPSISFDDFLKTITGSSR